MLNDPNCTSELHDLIGTTVKSTFNESDTVMDKSLPLSVPLESIYSDLSNLHTDGKSYKILCVIEKRDVKIITENTMLLELILMDKSETNFSCTVILLTDEGYPSVVEGDIICINNLKTYQSKGEIKGRCSSGKFMVVFGKVDGEIKKSLNPCLITDDDTTKAESLQQWYQNKSVTKKISNIMIGDYVNLVCQVVSIYVSRAETAVLKIWDGTISQILQSRSDLKENEVTQSDLYNFSKLYLVDLYIYGYHCNVVSSLEPGTIISVADAHLYSSKLNEMEPRLCIFEGNFQKRGIFILRELDENVIQLNITLDKIKSRIAQITTKLMEVEADCYPGVTAQRGQLSTRLDLPQRARHSPPSW